MKNSNIPSIFFLISLYSQSLIYVCTATAVGNCADTISGCQKQIQSHSILFNYLWKAGKCLLQGTDCITKLCWFMEIWLSLFPRVASLQLEEDYFKIWCWNPHHLNTSRKWVGNRVQIQKLLQCVIHVTACIRFRCKFPFQGSDSVCSRCYIRVAHGKTDIVFFLSFIIISFCWDGWLIQMWTAVLDYWKH